MLRSYYLPGTMASTHRTSAGQTNIIFDTRELRNEIPGVEAFWCMGVVFGVEVARRSTGLILESCIDMELRDTSDESEG
jgi:predicted oxidoreductase